MKANPLALCLLLALVMLPAPLGGEKEPLPPKGFFDIKSRQAATLLRKYPRIVILDIRTAGEFKKGHLKKARNLDYHAKDFSEQVAKLDKEQAYLVHCASGGRSGRSMKIFKEHGFPIVYHIEDGYRGWVEAELPVAVPGRKE